MSRKNDPLWLRYTPQFLRRRLEGRVSLHGILHNIGWLFFDKILRMGVGLLIGVWVARYLGPQQFGLLNFATALSGMFGAVAALGLKGIAVRDIVREPDRARLTLGTAALLQLIGRTVAYLLLLGTIAYLRPDDALARWIVALLGFVMVLKVSEIAEYWFEARVQSKYTVWAQNGVFLFVAAAKALLIVLHAPLIAFVWATVAEAAIGASILLVVMGRQGLALADLQASVGRAKELLKDSWPLILSSVAIMVYMKVDQIMLAEMLGDESVGVYSAAVRMSEVWYFIPVAIVASVNPSIIQAKKQSEELYYARLQQLYGVMSSISVPVAIAMTFLSGIIVDMLFGSAYAAAGSVLAIHIWTAVFVFMGLVSSKWFMIEHLQKITFRRTMIGAVINVVLNLWLIPKYGINGAAIATVAAQGSGTLLCDPLRKETRRLFVMKMASLNPLNILSLRAWRSV